MTKKTIVEYHADVARARGKLRAAATRLGEPEEVFSKREHREAELDIAAFDYARAVLALAERGKGG